MSNFTAMAKHPKTGEIMLADWIDDYFGCRLYGVRFKDNLSSSTQRTSVKGLGWR